MAATNISASAIAPQNISQQIVIYCDVGDLIFYLKQHLNVSGIQRVISSVVGSAPDLPRSGQIVWCMVDPIRNELRRIESGRLAALTKGIADRDASRTRLDALIEDIERHLHPCEPDAGDLFLIMGAFWVFDHAAATLLRMRRRGVRTALLVYDIIPIQHPEFCERRLTTVFARQMRSIVPLLDCAVTISEHVKLQFDDYLAKNNATVPTAAVPLGHDRLQPMERYRRCALLDFDGEYVLVVGTIEIRKNHIYLLNIWKQLLAGRGAENVPRLVLVGRQGWRVDDFVAQLDATDHLDGHVVVLPSVTDAELDELYRGCLFTMFPSFSEGWGLPVGESLSHGKLCVASSATSIPEIGGDLPIYVDPHNVSEGRSIVERLLDDRRFLASRTSRIKETFRPRGWGDYTLALFDTVQTLVDHHEPRPPSAAQVPEGSWLNLGTGSDSGLDAALALFGGWFPREDWGRWMSQRDTSIEFQGRPGALYRFIADIAVAPWLGHHGLKVYGQNVETVKIDRIPPTGGLIKTTALADRHGVVAIQLRCLGQFTSHPDDPRTLYIGMKRFMFYNMDDPIMFARGVEQMVFAPLNFL